MRNVTVTMEDSVAEWARLEAARRNTSVSRLVGEMLNRHDIPWVAAERDPKLVEAGRRAGDRSAGPALGSRAVQADDRRAEAPEARRRGGECGV